MSFFRVLLVESDPQESERISTVLESAQHEVLPLTSVADAADALDLQRFDAVVVPSNTSRDDLQAFAAKLRGLEQGPRVSQHVPILARQCDEQSAPPGEDVVEAYLPSAFDEKAFSDAVQRLALSVAAQEPKITDPKSPVARTAAGETSLSEEALAIFNTAAFEEQVCFDRELMVEIIDLYLAESQTQVEEMRAHLAEGNLPQLSRVAHTIKGSLSSLHAERARAHAQVLEHTAKAGQASESAAAFALLEQNLAVLSPELLRFRNA